MPSVSGVNTRHVRWGCILLSGVVALRSSVSAAGGESIVAFERDVRAYRGSTVTLRCNWSGSDGGISWSRADGRLPDRAVADGTLLTCVTRYTDVTHRRHSLP